MATLDASRCRPLPVHPARSAMRSITSQPMLWRVPAYCDPGLPRPTTSFNPTLRDSTTRPDPRTGGPVPRGSGGRGEVLLERWCRGLFGGFGVVPAADVEGPVGREQAKLVGRRPADV